MLAIHAWRSANSIEYFRALLPNTPLIVCLAGTDIYRFQKSHPKETRRSMAHADALVCLHNLVGRTIPKAYHSKLQIIRQSAAPLDRRPPLKRYFEIIVAGHLREEKDPLRAALAARRLNASSRLRIFHFGKAHDPQFERDAKREMWGNDRYLWFGEIPRWQVRRRMSRAQAMVISSRMEGGANVVSEAIMAGLPVIASKIDGNMGLLGSGYEGYYPVEDEAALAQVLAQFEGDVRFRKRLASQVRKLRPQFTEKRELGAWQNLLASLKQRGR